MPPIDDAEDPKSEHLEQSDLLGHDPALDDKKNTIFRMIPCLIINSCSVNLTVSW